MIPAAEPLAIAAVAVFAGSVVQGSIGFGSVLLALPLLGLVMPERIPQILFLTGIPLSGAMAVRERHAVEWRGVGTLFVGRLPGLVLGLVVLLIASAHAVELLFGMLTVAACAIVAMDRNGGTRVITPGAQVVAGFVSGVMDSAAGIGGPPLALLYAGAPAAVRRATLAVVFVLGNAFSLAGLVVAGRTTLGDVLVAAVLWVPVLAGLVAGHHVARRVDADRLRLAVIVVSAVGGVVLLREGLVA